MQVQIRGKKWNLCVLRENNSAYDRGQCDPPNKQGKQIRIYPAAFKTDHRLMETLIHEALHAACWDLDEELVEDFSHDVARILLKCGFSRTEDDDG